MMISTKKLIKMARKWQKKATASRRRISWLKTRVAEEGHLFIYTNDAKRFMIPLKYLNTEILKDLFRMAEDEFGLSSNGPIILPCHSIFMEYAIAVLPRHATHEFQRAFMLSFANLDCGSSLHSQHQHTHQQILVSS